MNMAESLSPILYQSVQQVDPRGRLMLATPRFARIVSYGQPENRGMHTTQIFQNIAPGLRYFV